MPKLIFFNFTNFTSFRDRRGVEGRGIIKEDFSKSIATKVSALDIY